MHGADNAAETHDTRLDEHAWAIVLAGGDGTRVAALSRDGAGNAVPKQYSAFGTGEMLLHGALRRTFTAVSPARVLVVVAEQHRRFWSAALTGLPPENVVVQPRNRGTGAGLLLPTLEVMRRDRDARLLVVPADHHVESSEVLQEALSAVVVATRAARSGLLLLGMADADADHEYGWIVPGARTADGPRSVVAFIEKPGAEAAQILATAGALVNSLIMAVRASELVSLYDSCLPDLLRAMECVPFTDGAEMSALYETLSTSDFSRSVLEQHPGRLRVLVVPPCGWSDLGTPTRLRHLLARHAPERRSPASSKPSSVAGV